MFLLFSVHNTYPELVNWYLLRIKYIFNIFNIGYDLDFIKNLELFNIYIIVIILN